MDLDLTQEQDLLRESVRGLCARHAGLDVVRSLENDPVGYPAELWRQFSDGGLTGMLVPEEFGGSGMSLLDGVLVYQELGRALSPSPHFVSAVAAAGAIVAGGDDEQRARLLPGIASGEDVVSVAWQEPGRGFGPKGVRLAAARGADGGLVLNGVKWQVPYASSASSFLVLAHDAAADATVLAVVPADAPGITLTQQNTIGSETQYKAEFADVAVAAADVLPGLDGDAWAAWDAAMHDAVVLLAALAVGGARRALEISVDYAKTRQQFDKPLGAFQALAHNLADAATTVDGAETLVWEAAWSRDNGRSTARLAPMAKLFACRVYRQVTDLAVHIHGGMGFTVECDVQLYFRRAKQLQLSWWDDRYLEGLVAAQVLDRV